MYYAKIMHKIKTKTFKDIENKFQLFHPPIRAQIHIQLAVRGRQLMVKLC
jgi:hypothetical protein